jgi:uncharacterized membrane protein YdjX (TVP38/TMEM64 family)
MKYTKFVVLVLVAAAVAAYFALGLGQYLNLQFLKDIQQAFQEYYAQHPVQIIAIYFGLYVLLAALSVPGATVATLAGGALFGLWLGTIIVSFASSIGATRTWTFYWVSQLGMLAGTVVRVNAGTGLAQINGLRDIMSPAIIGSFVLLAVFPFIVKKALDMFKRHRAYKE